MEKGTIHVLIVEDDAVLLHDLTIGFQEEGFIVHTAENGKEGLEVALAIKPHIILLDIIMPEMDGMSMLKKLRKENEWGEKVPVIILTNLMSVVGNIEDEIENTKPEQYLVKSEWKLEDVIQKVKETLAIS